MTRWGSIAYYLAAWLFGSLFTAVGVWLWVPGFPGVSGFLYIYYIALVFLAFSSLLFGFVLRRVMRLLALRQIVFWIAAGVIFELAILVLLAKLGGRFEKAMDARNWWHHILYFTLKGPLDVTRWSLWLPPAIGGVTAALLNLFERAFAPARQTDS